MSAFVVDANHIDALITAALAYSQGSFRWYAGPSNNRHELHPGENEDQVGAMLIAENRRSVSYHYPSQAELPGPIDTSGLDTYKFRSLPGYPDPITVLKAINCYRYQACETPDWEQSIAFAFCSALEHHAISRLPGYDDAPGWSINDRQVFVARRKPARIGGAA